MLSRREGLSLFMTLLAALQTLLSRYTGQDDISVGTFIANRNRAETEGLIGFFINNLVLRTDLSGNPSVRELLERVRQVTLDAYAHQDLPFEKLLEDLQPQRRLNRTPLFQVMLVLHNFLRTPLELPGFTIKPYVERKQDRAEFDLTLWLSEGPDGLACRFEYDTDLFEAATISRMARHFQTVLECVVANPEQRLGALPIMTDTEAHQLQDKRQHPQASEAVRTAADGMTHEAPRHASRSPAWADLSAVKRALLEKRLQGALPRVADTPSMPPHPPLDRRPNRDVAPLSFAQRRLWFLDQLEPGNPAYNIAPAYRLTGPLDVSVLVQCLNEIVRRHDVLRATFAIADGQPVQDIAPTFTLTVPVLDLQEWPEAKREAEVQRLAVEEATRPFDLNRGPLVRATVLQLGQQEHVLLLTLHHIVADGWSASLLLQELATLYTAFATTRPSPLAELPIQYADFAHWQQEWMQGEVLGEAARLLAAAARRGVSRPGAADGSAPAARAELPGRTAVIRVFHRVA